MSDTMEGLDLSTLTDDGDTLELPDGRVLRLKIEPDELSIMDEQGEGVWCGRLEWDSPRRENAYGHRLRPDGFTGRAEVIERDHRDRLWWEVPADVVIGSDGYHSLRQAILDLYHYGYSQVGLILECEHGGQLDAAWIGGVDVFYPELLPDLLGDLDMSRT